MSRQHRLTLARARGPRTTSNRLETMAAVLVLTPREGKPRDWGLRQEKKEEKEVVVEGVGLVALAAAVVGLEAVGPGPVSLRPVEMGM